jgi:hypothetical protein
MMDRPWEDSHLHPTQNVGRCMNIRDVHNNASTSACSVQYVCLVLIETELFNNVSYKE